MTLENREIQWSDQPRVIVNSRNRVRIRVDSLLPDMTTVDVIGERKLVNKRNGNAIKYKVNCSAP